MRKVLPWLAILLTACSTIATPVTIPTATVVYPTATEVMPTPMPTRTLAPFEEYTIDYLSRRSYGGGRIEVLGRISETELFTSYSIRYPSDGVTIYGFMNVPKGEGPFPVIVSIHGYAPNSSYDPFIVESDYADRFAANQFIVIHPGMRNQPPSDYGDNILRVGMTVDVMNLIALLKQKSELPGELERADTEMLGLEGTSLGGEIALRMITLSPDIKATVLFSSLSGNIFRNSKQLYDIVRDDQFLLDSQIPLELQERVSPMYYYYKVRSAVQLNHGTADATAPMSWADETCDFLQSAGVSVQCIYYKNAGHVFGGEEGEKFLQNALDFYRSQLYP